MKRDHCRTFGLMTICRTSRTKRDRTNGSAYVQYSSRLANLPAETLPVKPGEFERLLLAESSRWAVKLVSGRF